VPAPIGSDFVVFGDGGAIDQWTTEDASRLTLPTNPTCQPPEGVYAGGPFPSWLSRIQHAEWSPDGQFFMTSADQNCIIIRDANLNEKFRYFISGERAQFTQDSRYVLSVHRDRKGFDLVDLEDGKLATVAADEEKFATLSGGSISSDGEWATVESNENLKIHKKDESIDGRIAPGTFSPSGNYFVIADRGEVKIWRRNSGSTTPVPTQRLDLEKENWRSPFRFSKDETLLAASCNEALRVIDLPSGRVSELTKVSHPGLYHWGTGHVLFEAERDGIFVWAKAPEGKWKPTSLGRHSDRVNDLDVSSDGQWIITASKDRTVRVWDSTGKFCELTGYLNPPEIVCFSPDARQLAIGSGMAARICLGPGGTSAEMLRASKTVSNVNYDPNTRSVVPRETPLP
jgi:WD40 repeat protein